LQLLYINTVEQGDIDHSNLDRLKALLIKHGKTFATSSTDLGFSPIVQHDIDTGNARPIRQQPRLPPLAARNKEDRILDEMLESGIIRPSTSPWASPVCLAKKQDGTYRFCIDYRKLNAVTVSDAYPTPNVQDALDSLRGARYFATVDLLSGYWQLGMTERAIRCSAFCTKRGLFEFVRMPFGLKNAPSTFCRAMSTVLRDLLWDICLFYLDDVIIYARTQEELLERLDNVLSRLEEHGFKVKPSKCCLFRQHIQFLGHMVSANGIEPSPDKLQAIRDWPIPHCLREVRAFYGTASYYRRFVCNFAKTAEPLTRLFSKHCVFEWTDDAQEAFDKLKRALLQTPVLQFPHPDLPCILDTDASDVAIGAVLSQVVEGEERPIAFFSRVLDKAQRNYCSTRRELLAVIASLQHFRQYLIGRHILLRTDHHSLKWLNTFKRPEGILARWIETLSEFDYTIEHRAGKLHCNADGVSRPICKQCWGRQTKVPWIDQPLDRADELTEPFVVHTIRLMPELDDGEVATAQHNDPTLSLIIAWLIDNHSPSADNMRQLPLEGRNLWSQRDSLFLRSNVLLRHVNGNDQLIVPTSLRRKFFHVTHAGLLAAHLGPQRTLQQLQTFYYWPGMKKDIHDWYSQCDSCQRSKPPPSRCHAPMTKVIASAPMDLVAIDILSGLPATEHGYKYLLVATDYFTKWLEAYPLPDQEAATCVRALYNGFFSRFGLPRQLHADQGRNFESKLVQELCNLTGVHKTRTTPFHPRSDGQTERANKTILQMLRASADDNPADWPNRLPALLAAYRMTPHASTHESPNMLMFGRETLLPCTLIAAPPEADLSLSTPFVSSFRDTLRDAHARARANLQDTARIQKRYFDFRTRPRNFQLNQRVWLFWPRPLLKQNAHKLTQPWSGPWVIISFRSPIVADIQHETTGKKQTVHIDRLHTCTARVTTADAPSRTSAGTASGTPASQLPVRRVDVQTSLSDSEHQVSVTAAQLPRRSRRRRQRPAHLDSYVA